MDLDIVRRELTSEGDRWLRDRRRIATIAAALAADFALIGLYQYGGVKKLPDVPLRAFDSQKIMRSPHAYPFGVPDSAFAVIGCGAIIVLATARGSTQRPKLLDLALGAAVAGGVIGSLYYLREMVAVQKKLCAYCLAGATGFFAMGALAFRGIRRVLRS
jgi:uncharacterized membrane protein